MVTSSRPMHDRADAVEDPVARDRGQADAEQGEDQADQCAEVLEQDHRQLGLAGVPDELSSSCPPAASPPRSP